MEESQGQTAGTKVQAGKLPLIIPESVQTSRSSHCSAPGGLPPLPRGGLVIIMLSSCCLYAEKLDELAHAVPGETCHVTMLTTSSHHRFIHNSVIVTA